METPLLTFADKAVRYDTFLNDVAARIVSMMKADSDDPAYISQSKAFKLFGRGNVERWRRQGKIEPCKRPGKIEYPTARLKELQRTIQDYFE